MTSLCVLFRVDAGPYVGLGHLQRCLSLGAALHHYDVGCYFLTNDKPEALERAARFGFQGYNFEGGKSWGAADLEQTLAIADAQGCSAIVVDSDYEGADYLAQLRNAGYFVVAIEDTSPHLFPCHMVVNGDAHAKQLSYEPLSSDTTFLLGPEYCILRPEFWDVPLRPTSENVADILVTLGGSDPYDLMPQVIRTMDSISNPFEITAIIGPFFENLTQIKKVLQNTKRNITLVNSPDSVRDLMLKADLAISAGGQTLYELACVGCPTVAVRLAANQDGQIAVFEEAGFLRIAGHGNHSGIVDAISDTVKALMTDQQALAMMSASGQQLIDGKGALRVAQTIVEQMNKL